MNSQITDLGVLSELDLKEIQEIKDLTNSISLLALSKGIKIVPHTQHSIYEFSLLGSDKRGEIKKFLENYYAILSTRTSHRPNESTTVTEELEFLELTKEKFSLHSREDYTHLIELGDIIEVYYLNGIQLYRNFRFFEQCSYDLLILSIKEWFTLYERPQLVTSEILNSLNLVSQSLGNPIAGTTISTHTLRERYLDAKRIFNVYVKWFIPLYKKDSLLPEGFICTSHSEILIEGLDTNKIFHL